MYPESKPALQTALADGKVRYVGEPVAAVLASDAYAAEDASELVALDLEPLPVALSIDDAIARDAALLYEDFGTNVTNTIRQETGEVDKAFGEAVHVFDETFRIHRYGPIPMEREASLPRRTQRRGGSGFAPPRSSRTFCGRSSPER